MNFLELLNAVNYKNIFTSIVFLQAFASNQLPACHELSIDAKKLETLKEEHAAIIDASTNAYTNLANGVKVILELISAEKTALNLINRVEITKKVDCVMLLQKMHDIAAKKDHDQFMRITNAIGAINVGPQYMPSPLQIMPGIETHVIAKKEKFLSPGENPDTLLKDSVDDLITEYSTGMQAMRNHLTKEYEELERKFSDKKYWSSQEPAPLQRKVSDNVKTSVFCYSMHDIKNRLKAMIDEMDQLISKHSKISSPIKFEEKEKKSYSIYGGKVFGYRTELNASLQAQWTALLPVLYDFHQFAQNA